MGNKPQEQIIATKEQLAQAAVNAFLSGDDAQRQAIVDELTERARNEQEGR